MAYNFCWWLRNYFDITVLYCGGVPDRIRKMMQLVKMEKYERGKTYECDIFIRNSVWGEIPKNIIAKRMIEMRHANYKYLIDKGTLYQQYADMGIKEIVGCGEFVSKMSNLVLHDNPKTIKNILLPTRKVHKIIKLISCTRIDKEKGWDRMLKFMEMMRGANIKFQWDIFTNNPQKCTFEEVHFYKQRYDIWDYLANADYTVLLSDSEGLSYTVQESLQYKVPCIVTDVGGNTELIKDGYNGYVVPLNMDFDIHKIEKIPVCKEYDNHALEDWLEFLEYDGKINKEKIIKEFEKGEKEMRYLVEATNAFKKNSIIDSDTNTIPEEGTRWEINEDRARILTGANPYGVEFVKIIKVIKDNGQDVEIAKEEPIVEKAIKRKRKKAKNDL